MSTNREAPASSLERQFWLLAQLSPEGTAYHVPALFRVRGAFDVAAFERALAALTARHSALRTTFEERDGELLRVVHERLPASFAVESAAIAPDAPEIAAELRRRFDLSRGPLLRVRIWPATGGGHLVALTLHHVISDLATKNQLMAELAIDYARETGDADAAARTPTGSDYGRFAEAERAYLGSDAATRAEEYFAAHLAQADAALTLPEDAPRPKLASARGACVRFELEPALVHALEARSRALRTKPFLLLLTAYAVLLGRYANQTRVTIGVPLSNRRRETSHGVVGACMNNLPLHVDLGGQPSFDQLFARVRADMLGHHRHQELPFARIVARTRPVRDPSRNPVFQAGFTFEPPPELSLSGLEVETLEVHAGGAQLDLFMTLWESGEGFRGRIEYCTDLFHAETIERLLRCYLTLLEHALRDETRDTEVMRLPLLAARDYQDAVRKWNATARDYHAPPRLSDLFLAQSARTPDAVALSLGQRRVSYRELRARAFGLAHALQSAGVVPGDRVGIFMERSLEMVVAIYGTLFAGAAYLPLEPELPEQRLSYMLEDAAPTRVLTQAELRDRLSRAGVPLDVVAWDALPERATAPELTVRADYPAYVIFTSGSTGRPKGVANAHQGVVNRILWMQDTYRLGAEDVVLHKTPCGFDVSVWELFWPLSCGAALELAPPGVHRDPGALAKLIQAAHVTTIHFVPSMLEAFVAHPEAARCTGLRRIVCSGEALGARLVQKTLALLPAELENLYGPTEAAVDVTAFACRKEPGRDPVPIGKPIANCQLYVLDQARSPVPVGVTGELYIGGVQVALGYVRREDLTAERFVPDPFAGDPSARLYRTGDLARFQADGNLAYQGRVDHQVKIRGQRIELGEIETVLGAHPNVQQCVVVARKLGAEMQLVAYVVADSQVAAAEATLVETLRAHLLATLPSSMQPGQIVLLAALPLTASGKIDRKALPEPARATSHAAETTAPPSALEQWLGAQWCELLGVASVSVTDNLFELGASSLMCAQMVGRIRAQLQHDVPLVRLFEHPTIARLAAHLGSLDHAARAGRDALAGDSSLQAARDRAARMRAAQPKPPPRRPR